MTNQEQLPKDIGGYQHIEYGPVMQGDIWVSEGIPQAFVQDCYWGLPAIHVEAQDCHRIYRKMAVPSCRDDKTAWGEKLHASYHENIIYREPPAPFHFIPQDDKTRKEAPLYRGLLGYFPAACFEVARHSYTSDRKHNPNAVDGPTWARAKSSDHPDCIMRHLIDSGIRLGGPTPDDDQIYHLTALAWRGMALLQEALESRGAKPGVSSRL